MAIAVVIVSYNCSELLERCLTTVKDQRLAADRIIVVDNHSTEAETIQLLDHLSGVEVISMPHNAGYGSAINRAVEELEDDDLLCCLNPDAFAEPDWLENLVAAADANPGYASFATLMIDAENETLIDGAGDALHVSGIPWRRHHGAHLSDTRLTETPVFSACAGAALYRVSALREVGGFDESYFMYIEDVDLGFRLQLAGHPCLFVPSAIVRHIGSAVTGHRSDFSTYYGHRNLVWCYFRNMPLPLLLLLLPAQLLGTLATLVVVSLRGSASSVLRAKWDGYTKLSHGSVRGTKRNVSLGYLLSLFSLYR